MRILVVTSSYPKYAGDPTAPFIESLTTHVANLGHEVHVALPEHAEWRRPSREANVTFHLYRYSPIRQWTPWGFSQSLAGGTRLRRSLFALAPLVGLSGALACTAVARNRRIDVVHAHWVVPNGPIAALAAHRCRLPLVVTVHGSDVALAERSRLVGKLARWSLLRADAATAASTHLLDRVARLIGTQSSLKLVPLGTDLAAFHPDAAAALRVRRSLHIAADEVLVLGIGRLIDLKGFDHLVRAIALVRERAPNVRLVIAGDGDARAKLIDLSRSLGLADRALFVGMVSRDEAPGYFAAADLVAVPTVGHGESFGEGLGYVVLEAQASGKPVVASRVGGLPEVVSDGETGYLVADRDPDGLASAIIRLAEDPEQRRRLGESARARALAAPSWDAVARMWVELYKRIVDSHASASKGPSERRPDV